MSLNKILKGAIASAFAVFISLSPVWVLLVHQPATVAQTADCGDARATVELKYDDGIPYATLKDKYYGCQLCLEYQGVLFSLPGGLSSADLTAVRFYAGGGKGEVRVFVMGEDFTLLTSEVEGVGCQVTKEGWYEVQMPNISVPNPFYVFIRRKNNVMPFIDRRRDGPSWNGEEYDQLANEKRPPGDLLIRADVVPEAQVGGAEDYKTIQQAVDSVWEGWTIRVHEGTYNENVTVNKGVAIMSVSGPAKTIVQTSLPSSDSSVFRIAASCVTLSGFTIQGAMHTGRAGVYIDDSSGCLVSGNVIQDNTYGIYVSQGSMSNILLENECRYNTTGIHIDGVDNYVSGNKVHGNTASVGSAVFLSSVASGNQLRFNTIAVDPGTDSTLAASAQVFNQNTTEEVSAVENWWGTDTGPDNAGGQGPRVGEMVLFDPWLAKQPLRVKTVAARAGPLVLDSRSETSTLVTRQGIGTSYVSIASFAENPAGVFPHKPTEKWIDVLFSDTQGVDEVEIRVYYTAEELEALKLKQGSLRLFWWNGEKWKVCSKTGVDKKLDFVWAEFTLKTKPTPSNLTGTMFAVGVPKGGFAWWLIPLIVVIVILALILFRLLWVLVVRREGGYTSIH